ncbi:hypothetical protein PR202_ga28846 [Eleusine coracana subsp. coracana]|uniref:Uncharacterized protein n=1 Tax=Eleusine coracana subsp. coracana TaxID=191504 RepID=A0AAV5DJK9_ELECO|nr:hypothetical protein PR202_ga28846 [Eleusine coracana subsp. coracana]
MASSSSKPRTRTRPAPPPPSSPLVHLSFTTDASCFIVADASAVHWISCDAFNLRGLYQERDATRTVVAAAGDMRHEKASVCAVASRVAADAFVVRRWKPGFLNYHWRYDDWEAGGGAEVRAVHVHGDRTVLVLDDGRVDVHGADDEDGGVMHRVKTAAAGGNPLGLCAVSRADAPMVLACPAKEVEEVRVDRWVGDEFTTPLSIAAHSSRLACVAVSSDGRLVATASVKGTVVRVFCAAAGAMLRELRRGYDRADIHCLAFSPDSKWLAASSDKGTIHVFSVNVDLSSSPPEDGDESDAPKTASAAKPTQGWSSYLRGFIPVSVPSYFQQDYSLAKFRLREGIKYMVAFSHEPHVVLIIGMDGSFYRCQFDPVNGGDMEQLEYRNFMKPFALLLRAALSLEEKKNIGEPGEVSAHQRVGLDVLVRVAMASNSFLGTRHFPSWTGAVMICGWGTGYGEALAHLLCSAQRTKNLQAVEKPNGDCADYWKCTSYGGGASSKPLAIAVSRHEGERASQDQDGCGVEVMASREFGPSQ